MESDMENALNTLHEQSIVPRWNMVVEFCPDQRISVPRIDIPEVCLETYDALLEGRA
jgi:hypothetical protein